MLKVRVVYCVPPQELCTFSPGPSKPAEVKSVGAATFSLSCEARLKEHPGESRVFEYARNTMKYARRDDTPTSGESSIAKKNSLLIQRDSNIRKPKNMVAVSQAAAGGTTRLAARPRPRGARWSHPRAAANSGGDPADNSLPDASSCNIKFAAVANVEADDRDTRYSIYR